MNEKTHRIAQYIVCIRAARSGQRVKMVCREENLDRIIEEMEELMRKLSLTNLTLTRVEGGLCLVKSSGEKDPSQPKS